MTLNKILKCGLNVHFYWHLKRMEERGVRNFYMRMCYEVYHGDKFVADSIWKGYATAEGAIKSLMKNKVIENYCKELKKIKLERKNQ